MRPRLLSFALVPLLGTALLAAHVPSLPPLAHNVPLVAPPAPPNGTYLYAISRNGTDQGKTTVVLFRRDGEHVFETDEAGAVGAASAHVLAAYRYADFGVDAYAATYQAPFLRTSALGRALRFRAKPGFAGQTSVRYHLDDTVARVTVDGIPGETRFASARARWVFDAPFMTGVALLPAFARRTNGAPLVPTSIAFGGEEATAVPAKLERATPRFPKTPKDDLVLDLHGVAQIWFDPATFMVHEAHFDALNLDARLLSYTKAAEPAPFEPAPAPGPLASDPAKNVTVRNEDGTSLAGVLDVALAPRKETAAIVFVPAGPGGDRNQGGDGPSPMYPDLARTFAQRGYETLRYDMRGAGKSSGASTAETWTEALSDAEAAAEFMESDEDLDPKNIYFLGYGNGADLALAASAAMADPVGGVIALAPTVLGYRECVKRTLSPKPVESSAWMKSAIAHDPVALAMRSRAPLFVLHPGLAVCGEKPAEVTDYDEKLRVGNTRVTAITANDLSQRFAGRYDADAPANTEEFFPYRFDASTAGAIGDWLDGAKSAGGGSQLPSASGPRIAPPPPPPAPGRNDNEGGMPNPHLQTPLPRASLAPQAPSPAPSPA